MALLTAIMVFNYVDRLALGILLEEIKQDLALSDTQLGLLTGIAFALFYAIMGIPIARWADRGNRVNIVSLTCAVWSVAVASCGFAINFGQLLLLRIGVAIGEAGCHPPAFSIITDYFKRWECARAIARYMLGWPLALTIGYFAAGWLNELLGWRTTFVILGVPGVILAMLAKLTILEPRTVSVPAAEGYLEASEPAKEDRPPIYVVLSMLWKNLAYRNLLFCFALSYFFGNGVFQWQPTFFVRTHDMMTGEIGTWFALIYGIGGLIGTFVGGELAARYAPNNEPLQLRAMAWLYVVHGVLGAAVYLAPEQYSALGLLTVAAVGNALLAGPLFAATQTLVPREVRAMSIAVVLFFSNLIGLGLGPLAAGAISDVLRPAFGDDSLRYALLTLNPGYFICAWYLWHASRVYKRPRDSQSSPTSFV